MQRRRKSRRAPIGERFTPIRVVRQFARSLYLHDCALKYPTPFAWPFMEKLRACRSWVEFEHARSRAYHKFRIQWTRCKFGGRRPWFVCQCKKRVTKLYDTGHIVDCRHCLDMIYESQRRGEKGRAFLRASRIRLSIGGAPTIALPFPEKPRGMHRKTYERAKLKCEELEEPLRTNRHSVIGSRIRPPQEALQARSGSRLRGSGASIRHVGLAES